MVKIIESVDEIPRQGLVVIDFFATWCGPCKQIAPYYEQMAATFPSVTFLKANVDEFDDPANTFNVEVLPTFVFLRDGSIVETVKGADLNRVMKVLGDFEKGV